MVLGLIIAIAIPVILVLFVWGLYNGLIRLKNQVANAWAQIDVQLKRRADLIPNLIETVKGYMKHEKSVLENVTKARTSLMGAQSVSDKANSDNMLTGALKSLFAVSENYPQLKASENFMQLQEEITGTENKVAYARQHYNDTVMEFNTKIELFPHVIFARILNFVQKDMFKATEQERKNVKVSF
ncbi:MAG: LemA protein [Candidatus Woesearchaeota archaeon]|jgi:LemA protein